MKRLLDMICAIAGLLLLFPLMLLVALGVKLDSPGPVFYRGRRAGRFGKTFAIFKFRTMVVNAEKVGGPSTPDDDPRLTRIGRFLRRYKLDELPQLLNILQGEMSLVGPRPEVPLYVALLSPAERKVILSVRPGITDWASLWNSDEGAVLAESPDPENFFLARIRPEKVRLQLEYVRRRSFLVDLAIILRTIGVVIFRVRPRGPEAASAKTGDG